MLLLSRCLLCSGGGERADNDRSHRYAFTLMRARANSERQRAPRSIRHRRFMPSARCLPYATVAIIAIIISSMPLFTIDTLTPVAAAENTPAFQPPRLIAPLPADAAFIDTPRCFTFYASHAEAALHGDIYAIVIRC